MHELILAVSLSSQHGPVLLNILPLDLEMVHILVVEDNPDDAIMTMRALKRLNPRPTIKLVRDGFEAVECLIGQGACHAELVFLDLK